MALSAGNRTWYDPTHGISWRGTQLPFNTFYAVLCLFLFFFMAIICRLGYKGYRMEIRKAAKRTAARKLAIARQQQQQRSPRQNGAAPAGILKTDRGLATEDNSKPHVQFAGSDGSKEIAMYEGARVSTVKFTKLEEDIEDGFDQNGLLVLHL